MNTKEYEIRFIDDNKFEIIGLTSTYHSIGDYNSRLCGAVGLLNWSEDGEHTCRLMFIHREDNCDRYDEYNSGYSRVEFIPLYDECGKQVVLRSEKLFETPFAILSFNKHYEEHTYKNIDDNVTVSFYKI